MDSGGGEAGRAHSQPEQPQGASEGSDVDSNEKKSKEIARKAGR